MTEERKWRERGQGAHWVPRGFTDLFRAVDTWGARHEQFLKSLALGRSGLSGSCLSFTALEGTGSQPKV